MSQLDQVKVVLGNRVTALNHLSTDIDDVAHEVKRKSEQSEQYYRDVLGAMPVAIYLTDLAARLSTTMRQPWNSQDTVRRSVATSGV